MHKKLNRIYFKLIAVLLTGILMLGTVSMGMAHMQCLVEDHPMCDMHAGAMGNSNKSDNTSDDSLSTNMSCNHSDNSEVLVDILGQQDQMPGENCFCYFQPEVKSKNNVKPNVVNKQIGKTVLELESILTDTIFKSSKPFLFNGDHNPADYPTEAVYLVNASFII